MTRPSKCYFTVWHSDYGFNAFIIFPISCIALDFMILIISGEEYNYEVPHCAVFPLFTLFSLSN
jgi:hypothetical protein